MRFIYFTHNTLQIPRVARQCMVALCEAVAEWGVESEIVSFNVRLHKDEPSHPDFRSLYNIRAPLRVKSYPIPFVRTETSWAVTGFRLLAYSWHLFKVLLRTPRSVPVVTSARNYSILAMLILVRNLCRREISVLADVHGLCTNRLARWVHRHVDQNICITAALRDALRENFDLPACRLAVADTGV
jgi:hypothetical protein